MNTYVIRREKAWASPAELEATAERSKQVADDDFPDDIRWIRSYVIKEEGGTLGTVCIYQATNIEAVRDAREAGRHARRRGARGRGHGHHPAGSAAPGRVTRQSNPRCPKRRYLHHMSSLGGERKIATMLFADLVGSTELATELDPEDLRGRLEPFFDAARGALEQHGGTVEKYIGDAVMAVFGAPVAHGDDPDRAIAAALAVIDRVSAIDGKLAVRVGIETGEVLAVPESGDLRVTGEAVNAAARLQQAASPGEVLVGERTARACRRAQLERDGQVDAKGMDKPLPAFRAVAVCDEDELTDVPLVGREDDLAMLRLIARRAAQRAGAPARHRDRRGRDRQDQARRRALRRAPKRWLANGGRPQPAVRTRDRLLGARRDPARRRRDVRGRSRRPG